MTNTEPRNAFCIFSPDGLPQKYCWGETESTAWELLWRIRGGNKSRAAFLQECKQLGYRAVELTWDELSRAQGWG